MQDLKKNIFWIIAPVITLGSLFIFYRATGKLNEERETNLSTIDASYSSLRSIRSNNATHPNDSSQAGMQILIDDLKEDLREAWARQYSRQEGVLVWSPALGQDVTADLSLKTPIEFLVPYPGQSADEQRQLQEKTGRPVVEAQQRHREIYKLYVSQLLPELAKKIDANWTARTAGDGGGNGAEGGADGAAGAAAENGPAAEDSSLVDWSSANQTQLLQRFGWDNRTPSTAEVMYAQEDIWVLNQWMEVIARANRGSDARYNAAVTEIVSIELPQQGQGLSLSGRIRLPGGGRSGEAGGGGGGMDGMGGMGGMQGAMGGMMGGDGGGAPTNMADNMAGSESEDGDGGGDSGAGPGGSSAASRDPIDQRYVDRQYQPLDAAKIRGALNPTNKQAEDAYLAVAKRYPTRIRLKMDLRRLPDLLAACGNAPLTIEVRQVGINSSAQRGGGGEGGMMGGMMGGGGGGGMMGMGGGGGDGGPDGGGEGGAGGMASMMGGAGGMAGIQQAIDEFPYHEEVELYAIVYIFNPPDTSKLGKPEAADGGGEAAAGEAAGAD